MYVSHAISENILKTFGVIARAPKTNKNARIYNNHLTKTMLTKIEEDESEEHEQKQNQTTIWNNKV